MHLQDDVLGRSLDDPEAFWSRQADKLYWQTKPSRALQRSSSAGSSSAGSSSAGSSSAGNANDEAGQVGWSWFPDGQLSTCYNCVDRHVDAGRGADVAIYHDSPVTGTKGAMTYAQLLDEVSTLAGALREDGIQQGDVVMIYMPMIPAAVVAMLAVNRLGAIHSVVFGGFAGAALAQRMDACRPAALLTASCGIEGAKGPTAYRPLVEEACRLSSHPPRRTLIWQREQERWGPADRSQGQATWQKVVRSARARGVCVPQAVAVPSASPVYIIHTSGTTGQPKGVVREAAGHAVGLHLSMEYLFGIRGPGDVVLTASDIGWVVGHSYIVYGPLLVGAATVLYEGKPVGTPDAGALWRLVAEYRATALFTAPTALRAVRRDDPANSHFERVGKDAGLRSLRGLFLAGERSEPTLIQMYQDLLDRFAAPGAQVVDNWWSTEVGSPITGRALRPAAGDAAAAEVGDGAVVPPLRPGSAGKPMPGFDVRVVDDSGTELPRGSMGNIVLAMPLPPTAFRTLWRDHGRFVRGYLARFGGRWMDTGDAGMLDGDGYLHIMSRNDDVLNVSAHRLSSGNIEQAVASHPLVVESCVVGVPDALKGQLPFAFVTLATDPHPSSAVPSETLAAEIQALVRGQVGAIATLGGIVQGRGMIPRTRSGKTLRRVLRDLLELAVRGGDHLEKGEVAVPSTVEDAAVVDVARGKIREYFREKGGAHAAIESKL